jgi:hypothetical protein
VRAIPDNKKDNKKQAGDELDTPILDMPYAGRVITHD